MTRYWFARRFPPRGPRSAMAPVSREGRPVMAGFVPVAAFAGAKTEWPAMGRGDTRHMIADHRAGRVLPPQT